MKRLTLNVDRAIAEKAKEIARANGISISALFTQFVRSMATQENARPPKLGPITRELSDIIKLPPGKSDKELITEALLARYNRPK